jgi:hypothetical protein
MICINCGFDPAVRFNPAQKAARLVGYGIALTISLLAWAAIVRFTVWVWP